MANDFGLKVKVDGEAEFQKSLRAINTSMKTLGTEAKLVASEYKKNDKSAEALAARDVVLTKQITAQKEKVALLEGQLEKTREQYGANSAQAQKLEQQLNLAKAQMNNLGSETEDAAGKSAKANEKWEKFKQVMKNCATVAANVAVEVGKAAVEIGTKATKALADCTVKTASLADELITTSAQTGISTDKLQEMAYAAQLVDVDVETVTKSMAKNIKSMTNARKGSKDAAAAYEALGIKITDSNGKLRDSETVYWEMIDALGKVQNETERDSLAMTLLGKSAQDLNPLIQAGSSRMQELAQKAQDTGYVMSGDTLSAFGAFDDNLQYLKNGVTAATNALGGVLLPTLTELSDGGVNALASFTKSLQATDGSLGAIAGVIMQMLPQVIASLGELLSQIVGWLTENMPMIMDTLFQLLLTIGDTITELFPVVAQFLIDNLPVIIDTITQMLVSIIDWIVENLPMIIQTVLALIVSVASAILDNLPIIIQALVDALPQIIETLIAALPDIIMAITTIVLKIAENLPTIIKSLIASIPKVIGSIITSIKDCAPEFLSAGKELINGLWQGIKNTFNAVVDGVKDLGKGLIKGVKNVFGIHSPSKVFAQIGEYMGLGLEEGFTDEMNNAAKTMSAAVPTDFGADMTSSLNTTYGGGGTGLDLVLRALNEQAALLQQIAGKDTSVIITDTAIARSTSRYGATYGIKVGG